MPIEKLRFNSGVLLLRLGLGLIFFLFGCDKLMHPGHWVIYIPPLAVSLSRAVGIDVHRFIWLQGVAECALSLHVALGLFTRTAAAFMCLILTLIIFSIGLDQTGIRDLTILMMAAALLILKSGNWSADHWLSQNQPRQSGVKKRHE